LNEIQDIFAGHLIKSETLFEVFVKENAGDICKVNFFEIQRDDQMIYSYEKKPFYSSSDEVLFVYAGSAKLSQKNENDKSLKRFNEGTTFFLKKNGVIIQTPQNSTSTILNYYNI